MKMQVTILDEILNTQMIDPVLYFIVFLNFSSVFNFVNSCSLSSSFYLFWVYLAFFPLGS